MRVQISVGILLIILFGSISFCLGSTDTTTVSPDRKTERVILTEKDFKKLNCENVGDALQNLSGVSVSSLGEVSLRDVSSSKVVIIYDGQRLNTAGTTSVRVGNISIENIEKVELLRGGRSAQYGADAVGGVIIITSKTQQTTETTWTLGLRGSYGSYNNQIYGLNHSLATRNINYYISYKRETWDGNYLYYKDPYADPLVERITLENNHQSSHFFFFKAGMILQDDQNINTSFTYFNADNGTPGMTDNPTPNARIRFDNKSYNLNYDKKAIFKDFSLKVQSYFLDLQTKFDNPDGIVPVHSTHDNYALGIDLNQAGSLSELFDLTYGYSFRNDRINSTDIGEKERITHSAFTTITMGSELSGLFSSWDVALAVRYDAPSDFDSEFSPRLSVTLTSAGDLTTSLKSHVTKSYRAPSFNDLYWPRDAFAVGNPDLTPETGLNFDIGLNFSYTYFFLSTSAAVNYFRNKVEDLILWAQDPELDNLWTPKNISETETKGLETSITLDFFQGEFVLNGEYTYMEALDKGPDLNRYNKYLIYRPKHKGDVTSTVRFGNLEWNIFYHYIGLKYTNPANTVSLPPVHLFDTNITYKQPISKYSLSIILEITNITDEPYQRVINTAEPGRLFKTTLAFNF